MDTRGDGGFFTWHWCEMYGLSDTTANVLLDTGVCIGKHILALKPEDIQSMRIPMGQKCLLRGALLQYREGHVKVDRSIMNKHLTLRNTDTKKKRVNDILRVKALENLMANPDQREVVEGAHRADAWRCQGENMTLANWIVQQRNKMYEPRSTSVPVRSHVDQSDVQSCSSFVSSPPMLPGNAVPAVPSENIPSDPKSSDLITDTTLEQDINEILDKKEDHEVDLRSSKEPDRFSGARTLEIIEQFEKNLFTEEEQRLIESIRKHDDRQRQSEEERPSRKKRKAKKDVSIDSLKLLPDDDLERMINGDFDAELSKILSQ